MADGITAEQSAAEGTPACDAVVFGACIALLAVSPGNCTALCGLINGEALKLVDEEAPVLVDENAPEPLVDPAAPVVDPGSVAVGTLNGSQAAAVEMPPAEPFGMEQVVCIRTVPLEDAPGVTPGFT